MIASALALSLVGLAAASPITERQVTPHYPATEVSKGFHLVVNVTDPSRDFEPSIQNSYIASIHTGAGLALVGNVPSTQNARVFYQNGTSEEKRTGRSNVITDSGTPPFPSGLKLTKDKGSDVSTADLNAGSGSPGVGLAAFPSPYSYLYPETWLACNESLPYYQGQHFIIFKQIPQASADKAPAECVPVRLLPECTELNDLPDGSYSSHEWAIEDRCYKDVKSIKWSEYGP
ncbi:oxidoreductase CipA-like [Purpureocillium lavendulum]|uniref:Oxidoreductase CipA-like n=1 Tax=Purpureocillium lavendulum TaxID=1247861 RepID=A0AB34FI75_9HYPO|nr:oxidoreductase CipA-like [Purpureocillium lavendulum]